MSASNIIMSCAVRAGYRTVTELAKYTGIKRTTLSHKLQHPETFTGRELGIIAKLTEMKEADRAELLEELGE